MAENAPELELPTGERIRVERTLTLGRSNEADIVLADPEASRKHAQIRLENGICLISDLESRNGTAVNSVAVVEPRPLRDGDEIRIGRTRLVFRAPMSAQPAPVAAPLIEPTVQMPAVAPSPMQVLGQISRKISRIVDAKALADAVTAAIKDDYGCDGASLILIDDDADELYFASVASTEAASSLKLMTLKRGEGIAGQVIERKEPVVVGDVAGSTEHAADLDRALGFESRSIVAAPVIGPDGEVLGALEAVNPLRKPRFDADDMEFVSLVAGQLGVALVNARSWDAIERERVALSRVAGIRREFVAAATETLRTVVEVAELYAAGVPIYLGGEPGTGKRLLARLTHEAAPTGEFIEVDGLQGLPDDLQRLLERATLHVTHIESVSLEVQHSLAAGLASAGPRPVFVSGSASLLSLFGDGRLAPSLLPLFEAGQRLLPPLRSRQQELEPLIDHFVSELVVRLKREPFTFSPDAMQRMREYTWPGNVAQLEALVRRAAVLTRAPVVDLAQLEELAPELRTEAAPAGAASPPPGPIERKRRARIAIARETLASGESGQRLHAVRSLATLQGTEAAEVLAGYLAAPEAAVRSAAAGAFAARPDSADVLAARLEVETDPAVSAALLEALGATGEAAGYDPVRKALASRDPNIRRQAARALRRSSDSDVDEALLKLARDPDTRVRSEVLAASARAGDGAAIQNLRALMDDRSPETATAAIELCAELHLGEEHIAELAASGEPITRVAAIRALGRTGNEQAAASLIGCLNDASVRVDAIEALAELGAQEAAAALEAIAADAGVPVVARRSALRALASTVGAPAVSALAASLQEPELADAALDGLLLIASPESERLLLASLADGTPRVDAVAAAISGFAGMEAVEPLLIASARSPEHDLEVLESLVTIAARLPDRARLVAQMERLLEREELRLPGLQVLSELGDSIAVPLFLRYREWSQEARFALGRIGPAAVPDLLRALDGDERAAAEATLTEMGSAVVPALLPALAAPELRSAAMRIIEGVGESALPALLDAAEHPPAGALPAILELIGRVGPGRLASYIATFLESPVPEVRYAAIVALGDLPDPRGEGELLAALDSADTIAAGLAMLALGRTQSAQGFERLLARMGRSERKLEYANAAAVGRFNLRQPAVLALITRAVRQGMPFSAAAMEAAFRAGALEAGDILEALTASDVSTSQKLRVISALGRMPSELAVPVAIGLLESPQVDDALVGQIVAAIVRHESDAAPDIARLVLTPASRERGIAALEAMQEPRALMSVLRAVSPTFEADEELRRALRRKGDQLLGPLLDVLYENWDLDSLGLLWQLSEVVTEVTGSHPAQV